MIPLLIRIVGLIGGAIAAVIVIGIVLVVADANEDNGIVDFVLDVGRFFTEPFRRIIDLEPGKEHLQIAINWGIAAAVYLLVGALIAAALRAVAGRAAGGRRD